MDLEMVLNELSLNAPAKDIPTARQWMLDLLRTLRAAVKCGVPRVLRTHREFQGTLLAPDYPLAAWRSDNNVAREERLYFKSLTTKAPFLADLPEIESNILAFEFTHNGEAAQGLGTAFLLEALAISVRSGSRWESNQIELEVKRLAEDADLITENVLVFHASHPDHERSHDTWIQKRLQTSVRDGTDMWDRRVSLFPALIFCDSVCRQVQGLQARDPMLRAVVKRLLEMETYCKDWNEGPFNPDDLPSKASTESVSTLQQYGAERTFRCPDGEERVFSWHVRLTPGAWRIHFFPKTEERKIIIGYIGSHLPTVSDPT